MTLQDLREQVEAIRRGEYERWAFDPRVDYTTAVACLRQQVRLRAWQPWARAEVEAILNGLREE